MILMSWDFVGFRVWARALGPKIGPGTGPGPRDRANLWRRAQALDPPRPKNTKSSLLHCCLNVKNCILMILLQHISAKDIKWFVILQVNMSSKFKSLKTKNQINQFSNRLSINIRIENNIIPKDLIIKIW